MYLSTFEELLSKLLEQKPDLTRDIVEQKIQEKKDKIGAGYLTDQGAIFLIASDLGLTLAEPSKAEIGLKDLYAGASEVSLETRVLSLSPSKQFSRKDGSPFFLRTMTVYDTDSTASVKLWDEKANLPGIEELKPGDLIKIIKAYVKSDLNGAPTINIGSGSTIEPAETDSTIPSIDSITKDVGEIKEDDVNVVIVGTLDGMISPMKFTSAKGRPGTALKLSLKGNNSSSIRAVLWGKDESSIPRIIPANAKVKLYGVNARQGMQGELEIHGNDATTILIDGQKEVEPIVTRIVSIVKNESGDYLITGIDKDKSFMTITDSSENSSTFVEGDIIECMPSKVYGDSIWMDDDSFVRKLDDDPGIPAIEDIRTKVSDVSAGKNICIESIVLKKTERRDIQTKNGETISLSEMLVEDDSGQIWVKGWRNSARLIDKCSVGEVIHITGLNVKTGYEGRAEATLSVFSKITPKINPKSP